MEYAQTLNALSIDELVSTQRESKKRLLLLDLRHACASLLVILCWATTSLCAILILWALRQWAHGADEAAGLRLLQILLGAAGCVAAMKIRDLPQPTLNAHEPTKNLWSWQAEQIASAMEERAGERAAFFEAQSLASVVELGRRRRAARRI